METRPGQPAARIPRRAARARRPRRLHLRARYRAAPPEPAGLAAGRRQRHAAGRRLRLRRAASGRRHPRQRARQRRDADADDQLPRQGQARAACVPWLPSLMRAAASTFRRPSCSPLPASASPPRRAPSSGPARTGRHDHAPSSSGRTDRRRFHADRRAGPTATMLMADMGARVIKVEPPGGEMGRGLGPGWIGADARCSTGSTATSSACRSISSGPRVSTWRAGWWLPPISWWRACGPA